MAQVISRRSRAVKKKSSDVPLLKVPLAREGGGKKKGSYVSRLYFYRGGFDDPEERQSLVRRIFGSWGELPWGIILGVLVSLRLLGEP